MTQEKPKVKIEEDANGREHVCGIPLADFPKWYDCFHRKTKNTMNLELCGAAFVRECLAGNPANTVLQDEVNRFIYKVLLWGYSCEEQREQIFDWISNRQSKEVVARKVREGAEELQRNELAPALKKLLRKSGGIHGIGVSTASKILRFLSPEKIGVFDSVLEASLSECYKNDEDNNDYEGFKKFCEHCDDVAKRLLDDYGIKHPVSDLRENGKWLVADVEAVVFAYFNWHFHLDEKCPCPYCK